MASISDLLHREIGGHGARALLEAAHFEPGSSVADLAAAPDSAIAAWADPATLRHALRARDAARQLVRGALLPPQHGTRGPLRAHSEEAALGLVAKPDAQNFSPSEELARGGLRSAFQIAGSLDYVFEESSRISSFNRAVGHDEARVLFTFEERCLASGAAWLIPRVSLDEARKDAPPAWNHGPRDRCDLIRSQLRDVARAPASSRARRTHSHLAKEAAVRLMLQSIVGSWRSTRAGLRAYGSFMQAAFPLFPHFPVSELAFQTWATQFSNPDTLGQYVTHVRMGSRLLGVPTRGIDDTASAILRGARKFRQVRSLPRVDGDTLDRVVDLAVADHDAISARLYIIAYSFMLRVQSELWPLQLDGRQGLAPDSTDWHSQVSFTDDSATITLRRRKNSLTISTITRPCICRLKRTKRCGVCALRAQCNRHRRKAHSPRQPLFQDCPGARSTFLLQTRCWEAGLRCSSWHSFRRGGATDILRSGGTVAFLMHSGGWRSSAFLRYLLRTDVETRCALELAAAEPDSD